MLRAKEDRTAQGKHDDICAYEMAQGKRTPIKYRRIGLPKLYYNSRTEVTLPTVFLTISNKPYDQTKHGRINLTTKTNGYWCQATAVWSRTDQEPCKLMLSPNHFDTEYNKLLM